MVEQWKKTRFDRMVVDHLLRCGFYNSALQLARESQITVSILVWESKVLKL